MHLCGNENYDSDNGNCLSINDRWIHLVLTKIDSQFNCQIWIDGQYVSKFNQYDIFFYEMQQSSCPYNILLFSKLDNDSSGPPSKVRIADFNAFKRCLTLLEIQAIHQQQTSIKQVKVGTYIHMDQILSKESENIKINTRQWLSKPNSLNYLMKRASARWDGYSFCRSISVTIRNISRLFKRCPKGDEKK
ncbi:unnamed protein product [Rotaria sp. Silwood1]|nr:unnamed protein product [Rotaria sp. Silwood1]